MLDNIQELEIEKEKLEEALTYSDWSYDERELITKGIYWLLENGRTPLGLVYLTHLELYPDKKIDYRQEGKLARERLLKNK
jgi:hypothetical protein